MKLKTLKHHYYGGKFMRVHSVYMADKVHSDIVVGRGICEEIKMPTRKDKIKDKRHPKTRKKAILKK